MSDHQQRDDDDKDRETPSHPQQEQQQEQQQGADANTTSSPPASTTISGDDTPPRPSSDSALSSSRPELVIPWKCSVCDYDNDDPLTSKCAYCGTSRPSSTTQPTAQLSTAASSPIPADDFEPTSDPQGTQDSVGLNVGESKSSSSDSGNGDGENGSGDQEDQPTPLPSSSSSQVRPSSLLDSLRKTVDSVSERLLQVVQTADEDEDGEHNAFLDDSGATEEQKERDETIRNPQQSGNGQSQSQRQRPMESLSASTVTVPTSSAQGTTTNDVKDSDLNLFMDDEESTSPVAAPAEDISLEELFTRNLLPKSLGGIAYVDIETGNQEEEKFPERLDNPNVSPQTPPRPKVFEALPPSPQRQPQSFQIVEPWEMPPNSSSSDIPQHVPNLTATAPATPTKKKNKNGRLVDSTDDDESSPSPGKRLIRLIVCFLVLLVLVLSILLVRDRDGDRTILEGNDGAGGELVTPAPSAIPTMEPTIPLVTPIPSLPPSPPPTFVPTDHPTSNVTETIVPSQTPNLRPTTTPTIRPTDEPSNVPTMNPSSSPSVRPSPIPTPTLLPTTLAPVTVDFSVDATLLGSFLGSRLGREVAMDREGNVLAVLDGTGTVQVYHKTPSNNWELFSALALVEEAPIVHIDLQVMDGGVPMLAVASKASVRIWIYDAITTQQWLARGQVQLDWDVVPVTSPRVSLSSTGNHLATAHLEEEGLRLVVQPWQWNDDIMQWERQGNAIVRSTSSSPFLFLSLDLSSNNVVAISDWRIVDVEAVMVEAYEWHGPTQDWVLRGSPRTFPLGPADVVLTDDGNCLAVAAPTPGTARIYHWNPTLQDWDRLGSDLLGGSSVAVSSNGLRVVVGSPLSSAVVLYDWNQNENGEWDATTMLNGAVGDQFGASVALSGDGNVIAIGSPLDDDGNRNAGKTLIYT